MISRFSPNLRRLQAALHELQAELIAIPAFEESYLHLGLAIHFRCQAPGVERLRVNVMTVMRGVANDIENLEEALEQERRVEVLADRSYWAPLRQELERLRRAR